MLPQQWQGAHPVTQKGGEKQQDHKEINQSEEENIQKEASTCHTVEPMVRGG